MSKFDEKKISLAPQTNIEKLWPEVERILEAVDHPEALVTDESRIGDFPVDGEDAEEIAEELGVPVSPGDYIIVVAQRLKDKENGA